MKIYPTNLILTLLLIISFSVFAQTKSKKSAKKPNVIVIFADDLDADEVNITAKDPAWATFSTAKANGVKVGKKAGTPGLLTPNIDKLASEGAIFDRFYVTATVCTPSRYVLLTGRYATKGPQMLDLFPEGTQATLNWDPALLKEETNIAKEFQKKGYRTGIVGKWHNMPEDEIKTQKLKKEERKPHPTIEEFESYNHKMVNNYNANMDYFEEGYGWDVVDKMEWGNSVVNLGWMAEGALDFIEESKDEPFFLYLPLPVPHGQYRFDYNRVKDLNLMVSAEGILDRQPTVLPSSEDLYKRLQENNIPEENAMATHMDDYVGAVMNKLKELGIDENTLVIFTSDHGSRGKNSCYEGGARVPFFAYWPGHIKAGTRSSSLIASNDVVVTLADIVGIDLPNDMTEDGLSFVNQLMGKGEPKKWREHMLIEAGSSKGIVTKDYKYIANRVTPEIEAKMKANPKKVFWTGRDHHNYGTEKIYPGFWDADQLYNLNEDLFEQNNIADKEKGMVKKMQEILTEYMNELPHSFGEFSSKQ
ncbi:sulfatase family protein [Flammeovirga agarivorans]|uniref:Sulfatase-like hydrolase/transferase n=1 Tax=Flammeovirga agarivorans TaxID=2726742 RepID=A0A7X8XYA4_9BACT|nr:sulfatase-like hydrolase/transferase [Flammeovirga agarivorans]NLR93948.1 sulfatase-like hydrolase/transferase [Flammeovirga agarivorans]